MRLSKYTYSLLVAALCGWFTVHAQVDSRSVLGLPLATTVQMNGISSPVLGSLVFNTDDGYIYRYTSTGWQQVGADDQTLSLNDASLSIEDGNAVDLRSLRNTDNQDAFQFVSTDGTTGERDVFTIEDQDNGGGSQDHSSVLKVLKSGNIASADLGFSLIEATSSGSDPGSYKYFISGRTSDEGAPVFGVDISTANIWTQGRLYVGATGNPDGSFTEGNFTVRATGEIRSTNLAGSGNRMVVADATGTLSAQPIPTLTDTDDQALSLAGNTLTLEDGGTADLTPYLDNTDDQAITAFSLDGATHILTITLEDGGTQTVDLSALNNSGTDDQALSLAGNTLTLEDGGTVDLTPYLDNTDDQTAAEVNLVTAVDVDGDGTNETTTEGAVQAMAPIVSTAGRIFYPPSININVSATGTGFTRNLYNEYTNQFATPMVASPSAPASIPTYGAGELYYYITEYDTSVFANVSVSDTGLLTYDVIAVPTDYNTLINVVFVVR